MTSRPRILILTTAYLPLIGGSELAIKNITDRIGEYDFDILAGRGGSSQIGGPKIGLPISMAWKAWLMTRNRRYISVHAYQASQAAGAAWLLRFLRPNLPFILTLQEGKDLDHQPWLIRFFRALIIWRADRITAISNHLASYARRYTRVPVDIIPNGVDSMAFAPTLQHRPEGERIIISVSRLVQKNGLANLIRAMPKVIEYSPTRLVLVGGGSLKSELMWLTADQGIADHVEFVGGMVHEQLAAYLHQADVFVRPSLSEGLGTAFLEAMAAGVPIVASRVGGIADFLEHEKTGLVCDPSSPADIAAQIIRILTDDELRTRITRTAAAMVAERYDWNIIAKKMAHVYKEVSVL